MSKNKILTQYFDKLYSEQTNYKIICSKINNKNKIRKVINTSLLLLIIVISGITAPQIYAKIAWNIEYKEYENRNVNNYTMAINDAIEDGYVEDLDMEYVYNDGIGVKIDSLMITKDSYIMNVNLKFDNYKEINSDTLDFGFAVYDEENIIYAVYDRYDGGIGQADIYERKLYTELGIEYNKNDIYSQNQANTIVKEKLMSKDGNVVTQIRLKSLIGLPKSKKVYIRIFDIGFTMIDETIDSDGKIHINNAEDYKLSNFEWQFDIKVPEKFYKNNVIKLQLAENINGIKIEKAELSETGLILELKTIIDELERNMIYITDGSGKIYTYGSYIIEDDKTILSFDIAKKDLTKHLYFNINHPKYYGSIQLIQK